MEILIFVLIIAYVAIFFAAVFISLKFQWGKEGADERGKHILNTSYGIAMPLLPLGWFIIELFHDYVTPLSYETYKLLIWMLLTSLFILHASTLLVLKRRI